MQSLQSSVLWSSKVTVFKMPLKQQNSVLGPSGTTAGHHASFSGILVTPKHFIGCLFSQDAKPPPLYVYVCMCTCMCVWVGERGLITGSVPSAVASTQAIEKWACL